VTPRRHYPADVAQFAATAMIALFLCILLALVGLVIYSYGAAEGLPILLVMALGLAALLMSVAKGRR